MNSPVNTKSLLFLLLTIFYLPVPGMAQQKQDSYPVMETGVSFSIKGGLAYQFDTDLDDGGSFSANRFFIQGGPTYSIDPEKSISLAFGYGYDGYDFAGMSTLSPSSAWENIHSLRFSIPVRWGIDNQWSIIAAPTLRFTGENGANWDEAATGGGFAGFAYRVSDSLSIGPGIGILSQLEESASVFPLIIVNWKITDHLSLRTGGGLAATLGPGLSLNWQPEDNWEFMLGGRYEKLRFRLDDDNSNPSGIGEDSSFPLFIGATYSFARTTTLNIIGGMELGGELRMEDKDGRFLNKDHYDPAPFLGITFTDRF